MPMEELYLLSSVGNCEGKTTFSLCYLFVAPVNVKVVYSHFEQLTIAFEQLNIALRLYEMTVCSTQAL